MPNTGNFLDLNDRQLDQSIYRTTKEEYVFSLFSDGENVLSQVRNWKDKFENFQLQLGGVFNGTSFQFGFKDDFVGQCWTRASLSEAMWAIYASDPKQRYLRIRSTPRKLLSALISAHPEMAQDTCFIGSVEYKTEKKLREFAENEGYLDISPTRFARSLLLKRRAFRHEVEVRLILFGDAKKCDSCGLYRYSVDPHKMITQVMADPGRDKGSWLVDKKAIRDATHFSGEIKRSKIYDPPGWSLPEFSSAG